MKKMWHIHTVEYYVAIKKECFHVLCRDINEGRSHYSQQTNMGTENQTLHVLSHNWELNNENTWTQGGEHYTLKSVGGNRRGTAGGGELGRDSMGRNARYR